MHCKVKPETDWCSNKKKEKETFKMGTKKACSMKPRLLWELMRLSRASSKIIDRGKRSWEEEERCAIRTKIRMRVSRAMRGLKKDLKQAAGLDYSSLVIVISSERNDRGWPHTSTWKWYKKMTKEEYAPIEEFCSRNCLSFEVRNQYWKEDMEIYQYTSKIIISGWNSIKS